MRFHKTVNTLVPVPVAMPGVPRQRGHGINMLNNKLAVRYPRFISAR